MRQLTIATRLYLLIGLSTLTLVTVIAAALVGSGEMVTAGRNLHDQGAVVIQKVSRLALLFEEQEQLVGRAPAEIDRERLRQYRARFDRLSEELSDDLRRGAPLFDASVENAVSRLTVAFAAFRTDANAVFDFAQDFVQDRASDVLDGTLSSTIAEIDAILDGLLEAAAKTSDAEVEALSVARQSMVWTILGVSVLAVIIFNGFGIYIARRLTRELGRIITEMRALSAGDLESQMPARAERDEIGAMARALDVFRFEMAAGRQMAAELRRNQEHLARAQRIAGVGSLEQDVETRRLKWSAETCRMFGVSPDDVDESVDYFYRFIHPEDCELVKAEASKLASGTAPPPLEYRIIRPDGAVRTIYRESEILCDETGRPLRRIITFKETTETRAAQERERELERQLMHSQKLEALGTLAGGVAHDLNNTLVPILALSKLALDELPAENAVRGDIETIIRASERARDLVKQILAFSRKKDTAEEQVDLARVTREALRMLRASLPTTIQIVDQIAQVPAVLGDPSELHQVIVNLVTNAAHAIGGAVGKITVRLGDADKRRPPTQEATIVCLTIADTGCGMSAATLDRIFEPFFTTKGVGEGTGLGLSVVHGIITRHGGKIAVRSALGNGSEFALSFPIAAQNRGTAESDAIAA